MKNIIFILIMVLLTALPEISDAIEVGEKAPGFEAVSTHGTVILSEFEGNKHVVLALYYADFTPV
jgi:peroxiredoxin